MKNRHQTTTTITTRTQTSSPAKILTSSQYLFYTNFSLLFSLLDFKSSLVHSKENHTVHNYKNALRYPSRRCCRPDGRRHPRADLRSHPQEGIALHHRHVPRSRHAMLAHE